VRSLQGRDALHGGPLHQHYKERDLVFLTISVDYEGLEPVRKLIDKYHYHFPVLLDPKGKTLDLFEISKIPATVIIDKKGKMIGRVIGPGNWTHPDVFALIDQMLVVHHRNNAIFQRALG